MVRKSRNAAPPPVRLSTAVSCTCWWNSGFPPAFPISGSVQVTPRFPPAGPDGHGSPPSAVLSGRYDFLPPHDLRLIGFASRLRRRLPGFVSAMGAPAVMQARRRAGVYVVHAGLPYSSGLARGQEQDLPGSLATHPVTLRRSTTPDDPLRLATSGASGAAPTQLTMKASSLDRFRGCTPLHHLLSTSSRRALPHAVQDSLPAGGLRLCRAGVEPAGSRREVSVHGILLSRALPGAITVRCACCRQALRRTTCREAEVVGTRGLLGRVAEDVSLGIPRRLNRTFE